MQEMGQSLPPRNCGIWFKARLAGKAVLDLQGKAADGVTSEFLTIGSSVEKAFPVASLATCVIEKVGSVPSGVSRLFPLLATGLLSLFLLGMYVLIFQHTIEKTNCLPEELSMPEKAPVNMPHQPKEVLGRLHSNSSLALCWELSVWLNLRHCPCGLFPCQCVYLSILRWLHVA